MLQEQAAYISHPEPMISCSAFQKWPVKIIAIVGNINTRFQLSHVGKPLSKKFNLQEAPNYIPRIACALPS